MKIYASRISDMSDEEFLKNLAGTDAWVKIYDRHAEDYCYINVVKYNDIAYCVRSIPCDVVNTFRLDNEEDKDTVLNTEYGMYKDWVDVVRPIDMLTTEEMLTLGIETSHVSNNPYIRGIE